jgi:hypothetical protein
VERSKKNTKENLAPQAEPELKPTTFSDAYGVAYNNGNRAYMKSANSLGFEPGRWVAAVHPLFTIRIHALVTDFPAADVHTE